MTPRKLTEISDYTSIADTAVKVYVRRETFPLAQAFTISRGSKTHADVVMVELVDGSGMRVGRGECVPYGRYGETCDGVVHDLQPLSSAPQPMTLRALDQARTSLRTRGAQNALDASLWDASANLSHHSVWRALGVGTPKPISTFVTVSLAEPDTMGNETARLAQSGVSHIKLKLGGADDAARMSAARAAAPTATLIADANEGWQTDQLAALLDAARTQRLALIEQPLPAGDDHALAEIEHAVPICADESAHDVTQLDQLTARYDAINIKLDKTGGLTDALMLAEAARRRGLGVMVGSMVSTSLSMAAAYPLALQADWVDLDSPALLATDREHAMTITNGILSAPPSELWGG
ncbi:MAG: dipeptide epimerase [Pseudomonadota bacterium]